VSSVASLLQYEESCQPLLLANNVGGKRTVGKTRYTKQEAWYVGTGVVILAPPPSSVLDGRVYDGLNRQLKTYSCCYAGSSRVSSNTNK
jgi:hypothetical protein